LNYYIDNIKNWFFNKTLWRIVVNQLLETHFIQKLNKSQ
jgi:hypothetical protein